MKAVKKTRIFAATLLVAVLVFCNIMPAEGVSAASKSVDSGLPVSSIDKVASKIKDVDKYYKFKSRKPDTGDTEKKEEKTYEDGDPIDYSEDDLRLLSGIIYCEAGSMSEQARIAVANVIINRMNSKTDWKHVNTIREVIYDDKWGVQFSPIKGNPSSLDLAMELYDNLSDYKDKWQYKQMKNCISSAKKALNGEKAIPDSFMYFNGSIESSKEKCESKGKDYIVIDHHIYFE